ncbi:MULTISPECIES: DMT family transporter [Gordonibacter]|uniref:EamA family transporter n=1 Tax=Gordonibacter faecis TaxID=3047475 RepID=A0ABT7DNF6_9ACTN|nr:MULTISPECIES: EamA family transporter [unclassified Gordonibacter]MDJ1651074.1 EamA family transporter [Gordonibacter sp. KGMB12511]HIW75378.1 EamA family transporter [Candidatus Gordonibacter avicola]
MRDGIAAGAALLRRRHAKGVACALVGAGLWGFSGACAQFLLGNYDITPSFITAVRMLGAGVLFLLVLAVRSRAQLAAMLKDRSSVVQLVVFGAVGLFLCQITYAVVIGYTNAGTATVLQSTGIAFVMLFTCLFARKLPRAREAVGLVAALAATWLIATQGDPSALSMPLAGLMWGIANGLSVAFYIMYPKRLFARWGSFAVTGVGMFVGGVAAMVVLLAGAAWGQPAALPHLDVAGVAVLAIIAIVGTFAAFALYLHGVSIVGSVQGSLLGAIEPVSATAFSALWLGTAFSGADWIGFILMIAMIFLVTAEKPGQKVTPVVETEGERA